MAKFPMADIHPNCLSGWYAITGHTEQSDYWHDVTVDKFGLDKYYFTPDYFPFMLEANLIDWN